MAESASPFGRGPACDELDHGDERECVPEDHLEHFRHIKVKPQCRRNGIGKDEDQVIDR